MSIGNKKVPIGDLMRKDMMFKRLSKGMSEPEKYIAMYYYIL